MRNLHPVECLQTAKALHEIKCQVYTKILAMANSQAAILHATSFPTNMQIKHAIDQIGEELKEVLDQDEDNIPRMREEFAAVWKRNNLFNLE